jgi:hypothetical protein
MSKKLKVYGGYLFHKGKQVSALIATTSKKKASDLTGVTYKTLLDFWSETGNKEDIEFALKFPEQVLVASKFMGKDWKLREED